MKDRVVQFPHRYQLVPVAGEEGTYDIVAKPGTITEAGTPINKATLLSDETAALYGLTGEDATVDGALGQLGQQHLFGFVVYADVVSTTTLIKKIAIGPNKKYGRCIIKPNDKYNQNNHLTVYFSTDNTKSMMIGNISTAGKTVSISRRMLGKIAEDAEPYFGKGVTGNTSIDILETYINGENIEIHLVSVSESKAINCAIDWEVW